MHNKGIGWLLPAVEAMGQVICRLCAMPFVIRRGGSMQYLRLPALLGARVYYTLYHTCQLSALLACNTARRVSS